MLDEHSTSVSSFSYVIVFFRYAFLSDISYKERGYPCEYLQYIYAQSILTTSSEDF